MGVLWVRAATGSARAGIRLAAGILGTGVGVLARHPKTHHRCGDWDFTERLSRPGGRATLAPGCHFPRLGWGCRLPLRTWTTVRGQSRQAAPTSFRWEAQKPRKGVHARQDERTIAAQDPRQGTNGLGVLGAHRLPAELRLRRRQEFWALQTWQASGVRMFLHWK